jgi:hypothetical protein
MKRRIELFQLFPDSAMLALLFLVIGRYPPADNHPQDANKGWSDDLSVGCGRKTQRRPLRGSFPYEFFQAWGNLSFR